jgi:hypothetical protein
MTDPNIHFSKGLVRDSKAPELKWFLGEAQFSSYTMQKLHIPRK